MCERLDQKIGDTLLSLNCLYTQTTKVLLTLGSVNGQSKHIIKSFKDSYINLSSNWFFQEVHTHFRARYFGGILYGRLPSIIDIVTRMCLYALTRYSCNHVHEGVAIGPGASPPTKCTPVKVALDYWHSQLLYKPVETPTGNTIACPQACRPVRPFPRDIQGNRAAWEADDETLAANMAFHGVHIAEQHRVLSDEATVGRDSMRMLPPNERPSEEYPQHFYNFIRDLAVYQSRPDKEPNVQFFNTLKGCGRPGSRMTPNPCLVGWTGKELLMLRMKDWNGPPWTRWLGIDYGNVQHSQPRRTEEPARSSITVPISERLHQVLTLLDSGMQGQASGSNAPPPFAQPPHHFTGPQGPATGSNAPAVLQQPPQAVAESEGSELGEQHPSQSRRRASSLPERPAFTAQDGVTRTISTAGLLGPDLGLDTGSNEDAGEELPAAAGPSQSEEQRGTDGIDEAMSALEAFRLQEAELFRNSPE